ncbi:conserved hypothetical protein [Streptomyces griseoflavus Tu4000]|uniref:Uncharacterized protein n=1 Tax=Streptomyces griseoflavus Tu4000 TaxID=467200 RepID=D9XYJ8_9ACTN|nr:conserved hypothetical protein [Streptomyces griseoflavus Tu4000]
MACVWGLLGASAIEAHQLHSAIGRVKNLPWKVQGELPLMPYLVALVLRLALGVGTAAAFGASGQAGGPVGVMAVGIAAPKVLEQLAGGKLAELEMLRAGRSVLAADQPEPGAEPRQAVPPDSVQSLQSDADSTRIPESVPDQRPGPGPAPAEGVGDG